MLLLLALGRESRLAAGPDDAALPLLRTPLVSACLAAGRMKDAPAVAEGKQERRGEDRARPCPIKANGSSPTHTRKGKRDDRTASRC